MSWIDDEFKENKYSDERLGKLLCKFVKPFYKRVFGNKWDMTYPSNTSSHSAMKIKIKCTDV